MTADEAFLTVVAVICASAFLTLVIVAWWLARRMGEEDAQALKDRHDYEEDREFRRINGLPPVPPPNSRRGGFG